MHRNSTYDPASRLGPATLTNRTAGGEGLYTLPALNIVARAPKFGYHPAFGAQLVVGVYQQKVSTHHPPKMCTVLKLLQLKLLYAVLQTILTGAHTSSSLQLWESQHQLHQSCL